MKEKQPKIAMDAIREQIEKTDGVECRLKPRFKPQVLVQLYDKNKTEIDIYEYASPIFNVFTGGESISTVIFHLSVLPKELKPLMIDRMMCNAVIVTPWYSHTILGAMAEVRDAKLLIYVENHDAEKLIIKHIKQ
jgi:hypothetical protein